MSTGCTRDGFTLAELLIALLILGVIATFTIPKVLQSQQNSQFKATGKETAAMVSGAYEAYKNSNTATASTSVADLTPFMNYVSVQTSGEINNRPPIFTSIDCAAANCYRLHNGGTLSFPAGQTFNSTATTNAVYVRFDPDNSYNSTFALTIFLYYNGRISTYASIEPNTCASDMCRNPNPANDPAWFDWN